MIVKERIQEGMNQIIAALKMDQSQRGSWDYAFETGVATDCYMIILLRTLEINEEKLIQGLAKRIISKQEKNGSWKLFHDENSGNITATVEAYYALLYSGYLPKSDSRLRAAKQFILAKGGMEESHLFTKVLLSVTGQQNWPSFFPLPLEILLLPPSFPVNFYSFSEFGRANMAPIMILADRKFQVKSTKSPNLTDLSAYRNPVFFSRKEQDEWRGLASAISEGISHLIGIPGQLHRMATEKAKQYMLDRIEPDGTLFGYFSATFMMIFALLALGYPKNHPVIMKAVKGLMDMECTIDGLPHMQYTTAAVWNTSLISYALQEAGVSPLDFAVKKGNEYLLSRQHYKYGDWVIHNPSGFPGGWGFADMNTVHPDVDDTTASLRSIARMVQSNSRFRQSWDRGVLWVLSMQNEDGGWPAFERNIDSKLLKLLPIDKAEFILADPSSADLTGRTLEFLGAYTNLPKNSEAIRSGVKWLFKNQESNGSWYGRWGICYIYGTWCAVTGLRQAGVPSENPSISKASNWLKAIQNGDGGWGESCRSDIKGSYVPLQTSTLTHTAWAVDALIASFDQPTKEIDDGILFMLENLDRDDWTTDYPKGQGMAGNFYIHYHSYRYIFPLLALSHYQKKYIHD